MPRAFQFISRVLLVCLVCLLQKLTMFATVSRNRIHMDKKKEESIRHDQIQALMNAMREYCTFLPAFPNIEVTTLDNIIQTDTTYHLI